MGLQEEYTEQRATVLRELEKLDHLVQKLFDGDSAVYSSDHPLPKSGPLRPEEVLEGIATHAKRGATCRELLVDVNVGRPRERVREDEMRRVLQDLDARNQISEQRFAGGKKLYTLRKKH